MVGMLLLDITTNQQIVQHGTVAQSLYITSECYNKRAMDIEFTLMPDL